LPDASRSMRESRRHVPMRSWSRLPTTFRVNPEASS